MSCTGAGFGEGYSALSTTYCNLASTEYMKVRNRSARLVWNTEILLRWPRPPHWKSRISVRSTLLSDRRTGAGCTKRRRCRSHALSKLIPACNILMPGQNIITRPQSMRDGQRDLTSQVYSQKPPHIYCRQIGQSREGA